MPKNTSSIQRDRAWLIDRSAPSAWTTSSFLDEAHLRRILRCYVRYYNDAERIGHWRKIRLSLVRFSGPDASNRIPSSADSITTMPGFKFSVRTPANVNPTEIDAIRRAMTPMVATPHGGDWSKVESFHVEDKEPGKTSGKIRGICRCCRSGRCSPTRCACDQREAEKSRESELE